MTRFTHYQVVTEVQSKEQGAELAQKIGGMVTVLYGPNWFGLGGPIADKPGPVSFSLLGSLLRTYEIGGAFTLLILAGYGIAEIGPVWLIYLSARYGTLAAFVAITWIIMAFVSLLKLITDTIGIHTWHDDKK